MILCYMCWVEFQNCNISDFSRIVFAPDPAPASHQMIDSKINITHKNSIHFAVKACVDGDLFLSSQYLSMENSIFIVIGGWGNKRSMIQ